jgi:hypothetical protein
MCAEEFLKDAKKELKNLLNLEVWIIRSLQRWAKGFEFWQKKYFLFPTTSRPVVGPLQSPVQWVARPISSGVKRPGPEAATHLLVSRLKMVELYLHSPICLHGIVLN